MLGRILLSTLGRRMMSAYDLTMTIADLIEAYGPWGVTDEGGVLYDHPFDAILLQKCEGVPVTHGPLATDGDCSGSVMSQANWNNVPSWIIDGFGNATWRYHDQTGIDPFARIIYNKAEVWQSATGQTPGELSQAEPTVQEVPRVLPMPQVGMRGGTPSRTRTTHPDPLPRLRPSERRKGRWQRGYALAAHVYGEVDELREAVDILHGCLGSKCKRKGAKGVLAKGADIARCAGTMNIGCMATGLLLNQLEDLVLGRAQGKAGQATRGLRGGVGSAITGPAL